MDDSTSAKLVGTLGLDLNFQEPDGSRQRPYILKLERKQCFDDAEEKEVHAAPYPDARGVSPNLRQYLGRRIEVTGHPMPQHSPHHARNVVMLVKTVRAR